MDLVLFLILVSMGLGTDWYGQCWDGNGLGPVLVLVGMGLGLVLLVSMGCCICSAWYGSWTFLF